MDINTIKVIRNIVNNKEAESNKTQEKQLDKRDDKKGCIKLADYMAF